MTVMPHTAPSRTNPSRTALDDDAGVGGGAVLRMPRKPRRKLEGLAELLEQRTDLRGAYAPADYLEEAIRWSA